MVDAGVVSADSAEDDVPTLALSDTVFLLLALLFPVLVVGTAINIGLPSLSERFEIDFVDLDDAFLTEIGLLLDDLLGLLLPILAKWWGWIG